MDTLSSSVSTIKLLPATAPPRRRSSSSSTTREPIHHHHFKSRRPSTSSRPHLISSSSGRASGSGSATTSFAPSRPREATSIRPTASLHPGLHQRAASGYAAALIDAAQTDGSLELLRQDVWRLSRLFRNDQLLEVLREPSLSARDKGAILREVVSASEPRRKLHRHLMALLNMFIGKEKLHLVADTLDEFARIYAALSWRHQPVPAPP